MNGLNNKVIVVTGSAGLLGSCFCSYLRESGAIVIEADIANARDQYFVDITDPVSVEQLIKSVLDKYAVIDGWVNNAYPRTSDWGKNLEEINIDSWRKNVDMHLNGYFICCQKILPVMKAQNNGSLVNMASIYGFAGPDFTVYEGTTLTSPAAYSAIKGGIINLTRYLASYYGAYNVRVNSLSPGGIFDNQPESFVKNYEHKVPMRRMGLPGDIAPSLAFLLSDGSAYITGHNLIVDGGWSVV